MRVKVRYMLWLREKTGVEQEDYILDDGATLKDLINAILNKHEELSNQLEGIFSDDNPFIILVNGKTGRKNYVLRDNDIVTILPPISGG